MDNQQQETYCSDEGVYLNSKGEVVYGKDPDRKTQLVAPGGMVTPDLARRYNIVQPKPAPSRAPKKGEESPIDVEAENAKARKAAERVDAGVPQEKAFDDAPQNKARQSAAKK